MGTQYVDDHRFMLCKGSTVTDITRAVSGPEARDELDALSVELTFTAVRNNNRDKYMHWYGIEPGDKLRVVNHGREVFSGVILTVGLDGTVTANDMGWYLTKSEIILQLADAAAPDAVRRMCAKAGIAAGTIDLPPTRISQVWVGSTPEQILEDILAICSAETGLTYRRRVREGALQVGPLPTTPIIAYHKPAENLGAFDITLAKGSVSGSDSMAELTNSVVLAAGGQSAETLGRAYNSASIAKYGLLQAVETLSGDENTAQARQRLQTLLTQETGSPGSGPWMKSGGGRGGKRHPFAIPAQQLWRDRGAAGHRRHPPLWAPPPDEFDGGGPPIPPGRRRRDTITV